LGLNFDVPMFFFQGDHDLHLPTSEVEAYAAEIKAPTKMLSLLQGGGHSAFLLREEFLSLLNRHVRPLADPRG
jgi:pimeloyl-ACP methyl ester carboxylesterase